MQCSPRIAHRIPYRDESKSAQVEFEGVGWVVWIEAKGTEASEVVERPI
jgi:hypothetical protein